MHWELTQLLSNFLFNSTISISYQILKIGLACECLIKSDGSWGQGSDFIFDLLNFECWIIMLNWGGLILHIIKITLLKSSENSNVANILQGEDNLWLKQTVQLLNLQTKKNSIQSNTFMTMRRLSNNGLVISAWRPFNIFILWKDIYPFIQMKESTNASIAIRHLDRTPLSRNIYLLCIQTTNLMFANIAKSVLAESQY